MLLDETVRADPPIKARTYQLSTLDQYKPKSWIPRMLYFSLETDYEPIQIFARLRQALKKLLCVYPELTSHIVRDPRRTHWIALQTADDAGIKFIYNDLRDDEALSYQVLERRGYPVQGFLSIAFPVVVQSAITEGSCVFAAQANFVRGGMILATAVNHVLFDAGSLYELYRLWSKLTANPGEAILPYSRRSVVEQLSRGMMNGQLDPNSWMIGESARSLLYIPPAGTADDPIARADLSKGVEQRTATVGSSPCLWSISSQKQKEVKQLANSWSTMDAICSLVWHRHVMHTNLLKDGFVKTHARLLIDMRGRLEPNISSRYLGNTATVLTVEAMMADFEDSDNLKTTAQSIRRSINAQSQANFETMIATMNDLPLDKALVSPFSPIHKGCIMLNDHSKNNIYELDWGQGLGKADRLRDALDAIPVRNLAFCLFLPKLPDGTLEILTLFDEEVNFALMNDVVFQEYCEAVTDGRL